MRISAGDRRMTDIRHVCAAVLAVCMAAAPAPAVDFVVGQPSTATFHGTFGGFGAEWDPMFWNTYNQSQGCTQSDWDLIVSRVVQMRVPIVRMMFQVYWCCTDPNLATWNWTSAQMQSVFRYLDVCQANGIDVVFTDWGWGAQRWHNPRLVDSPDDIRFARAIAMYLEELIVNRGYTCIKYFVCGNEPDNEIVPRYSLDVYYRMYRNIHQELTARGIRHRVKLTGPDMGGQWDFFKNFISSMHAVVDAYDFHRYSPFNETSNIGITYDYEALWPMMDMWRSEVSARDPAGAGKPILLTEFGGGDGGTFTHPMIDTYDYALHMADYGTTLLTTRVNAAIAWCMHDTYLDWNQRMVWGVWRYKDAGWQLRPWAHPYALLTRHAHRGSVQCPVNGSPPSHPGLTPYRCAALRRPDGTWAVFLVNRTTASAQFNVSLPYAPRYPVVQYVVDRNTYARDASTIIVPAVSTMAVGRNLSLMLGASSFMVLSETAEMPPNQPPTVTMTSPVSGSTYTAPAGITLAATASDPDGTVVNVRFYQGNTLIGTDTATPYEGAWVGVSAGTYQLRAVAIDDQGATSTSTVVTVTVLSSSTPPVWYTLTTAVNPANSGSVNPASGTYLAGSQIQVTATPNANYTFSNWSGDATGNNPTITLTMDADKSIVANFSAVNSSPTVSITSPSDGATYTAPASITITATATDSDGTIAVVRFYSGDSIIGQSSASPYQYTWTNVPAGSYVLTAQAEDNGGAVGISAGVTITVNPEAQPPQAELKAGEARIVTDNGSYLDVTGGETAVIRFRAMRAGRVDVRVYDLKGRLLWESFEHADGVNPATVWWPGAVIGSTEKAASGVYLIMVKGAGVDSRLKIAVRR